MFTTLALAVLLCSPAHAASLTESDAAWLEIKLAPAEVLEGQERLDFLWSLLTPDLAPDLSAAITRAIRTAEESGSTHEALMEAALADKPVAAAEPAGSAAPASGSPWGANSTAASSEPAPDSEPPLAIPAQPSAVARPAQKAPPAPTAAPPAPPATRVVDPVRAWRSRHLELRSDYAYAMTSSSSVGFGMGWGGPGWGTSWGVAQAYGHPAYVSGSWSIYQGVQRLSVPQYLGVLGREDERRALEADIARFERRGRVLYGVGVAGAITSVVGVIGWSGADTRDQAAGWAGATYAGLGAAVIGLIGGSVPTSKASNLLHDPTASFGFGEVENDVGIYNEQLRVELGLSPADLRDLQSAEGRRATMTLIPMATPGGVRIGVGVGGRW